MKFSTAKLLLTVATTTTMFGFLSAPVSAFMLNQVSASWDNVDLTKWSYDSSVQNWVSRDDGTVTAANPEKRVEFHSNGLDSKVLWGDPANHLNAKSGLGFTGLENLTLSVGEVFNIGTLRHYNHTISSNAPIGIQADMSLTLDFNDLGIGQQVFDFELNIDETLNDASYHAAGQCPYITTGSGCSDAITWTNSIGSQSFSVDNQDYTLELVGFANSFSGDLVDRFVSQEQGISETNLYARLVNAPQPVVPQEIPEPASLLGLGLFGAAIATRRRSS
ncbi:MAG: THxN family PEP-CTERM protein [Cyanobacteria bacterium P01_F01_bin.150]